jgi:hypothetical protein
VTVQPIRLPYSFAAYLAAELAPSASSNAINAMNKPGRRRWRIVGRPAQDAEDRDHRRENTLSPEDRPLRTQMGLIPSDLLWPTLWLCENAAVVLECF